MLFFLDAMVSSVSVPTDQLYTL